MLYDEYNREERYICFHLFRLLHETKFDFYSLKQFLGRAVDPKKVRIFAEVALIRDAYFARKRDALTFMDRLVKIVAGNADHSKYTLYSELADELKDPSLTHPNQIALKMRSKFRHLMKELDSSIYGAIQGYFNAKPDFAVCIDDEILIYEAKLTSKFEKEQLMRTEAIGRIWAELLYEDLGYPKQPTVTVVKLGLKKMDPDVSWEHILNIAEHVYGKNDRTYQALCFATSL